jgi:hypothetical protein
LSKAREAGAKVGEAMAKAANQAAEALANGAITAKIKSKMVLDDSDVAESRVYRPVSDSPSQAARSEFDRRVSL